MLMIVFTHNLALLIRASKMEISTEIDVVTSSAHFALIATPLNLSMEQNANEDISDISTSSQNQEPKDIIPV